MLQKEADTYDRQPLTSIFHLEPPQLHPAEALSLDVLFVTRCRLPATRLPLWIPEGGCLYGYLSLLGRTYAEFISLKHPRAERF